MSQRIFVRPSFAAIVLLIADHFDIRPDELKRKSRGRGRKALAFLASEDAGLTFVAIAEWMGVTEWGASKISHAGRELSAADDSFRQIIHPRWQRWGQTFDFRLPSQPGQIRITIDSFQT